VAHLLLLTNTLAPSAEVLPSLALLSHQVHILPAEPSALIDRPTADAVLVDARRELAKARSLCMLLRVTGISVPLLAILTEGGLAGLTAEWGVDDVLLESAGPAEIEARLRVATGTLALSGDDLVTSTQITSGDLFIGRHPAAGPDLQGVRADQAPRAAPRPGLHPSPAVTGGVGL